MITIVINYSDYLLHGNKMVIISPSIIRYHLHLSCINPR